MATTPITGSYHLTEDDWSRAGLVAAQATTPSRSWRLLLGSVHVLFWSCLGLTIAAYAWIVDDAPAFKGYAQVMGLLFAMALVLRIALETAQRRAAVHASRHDVPHDIELTLSDDGMQVAYLGIVLKTPWSLVRTARQDDRNLYLLLAAGSVLPVPLAANPALIARLLDRTSRSSATG
jgi:hypothetical protein